MMRSRRGLHAMVAALLIGQAVTLGNTFIPEAAMVIIFAVMGAVILVGVMADQIFTERRNRRQIALMREMSAREAQSS